MSSLQELLSRSNWRQHPQQRKRPFGCKSEIIGLQLMIPYLQRSSLIIVPILCVIYQQILRKASNCMLITRFNKLWSLIARENSILQLGISTDSQTTPMSMLRVNNSSCSKQSLVQYCLQLVTTNICWWVPFTKTREANLWIPTMISCTRYSWAMSLGCKM